MSWRGLLWTPLCVLLRLCPVFTQFPLRALCHSVQVSLFPDPALSTRRCVPQLCCKRPRTGTFFLPSCVPGLDTQEGPGI